MGIEADPAVIGNVASGLRGAGDDLNGSATQPPEPVAGEITGFIGATLAVLCEGVGNVAASASALGDAVAEGKTEYETRDYDEALNLKRTQAGEG